MAQAHNGSHCLMYRVHVSSDCLQKNRKIRYSSSAMNEFNVSVHLNKIRLDTPSSDLSL